MAEKLSWSELRRALAQRANVSEKEANSFLTALNAQLIEALKNDKQVKINGLGTFKLQAVAPRKSVDVTTGSEITIEGYNKVAFVPEAGVKELIEKLEIEGTEVAAEGVIDPIQKLGAQADEIVGILGDLGELPKEEEEEPVVEEPVESEEPVEEPVEEPAPVVEEEAKVEEPVESEEPVAEEPVEEPAPVVEEEAKVEEPVEEPAPVVVEEPAPVVVEEPKVEEPAPVVVEEPSPVVAEEPKVEEPAPVVVEEPKKEEPANDEPMFVLTNPKKDKKEKKTEKKEGKKKNVFLITLLICLIVLLILCIIGYFFLRKQVVEWFDVLKEKVDKMELFHKNAAPSEEVAEAAGEDELVLEVPAEEAETEEAKVESGEPKAKSQEPKVDSKKAEKAKYADLLLTEEITEGSRLAWISRKYYGHPDYWVYLYDANKDRIDNPSNVPVGTPIRVPKLTKTQRDMTSSEYLRVKAEAVAAIQ